MKTCFPILRSRQQSRLFVRMLGFPSLMLFFLAADPAALSGDPPNLVLARLVHKAEQNGETHIVLPPGTYRLADPLLLDRVKNMDIDGTGVCLIMTRSRGALDLEKCDNVTVRGLTLDYDPLPFTQATITDISPDGKIVHFAIHAGYPSLWPDLKIAPRHIFDPTTRHWKEGANVFATPQLEADPDGRSGRALFKEPQKMIAPGDLIAFDRRNLDHFSCITIKESGSVTLEDIWVRASPGLAICGRNCTERTVLRRVRIAPGPRPDGADQDRVLSSNADGANFAECRHGPLLDNCDFSFMGDDSLNVHGLFFPVTGIESPTALEVVRPYPAPESFLRVIHRGDTLRLMEQGTFAEVGRSQIVSIDPLPTPIDLTASEVGALYPQAPIHSNPSLPYGVYRVVLSAPLPKAKVGQWFDVPEINCPGFEVRNSFFHDHRARGLRIQGNDGIVQGNRFERIGSAAIQVGPEIRYWREAGWVENVHITGNTLSNVGIGGDLLLPSSYTPGAITVCGRTDTPPPIPYPGNKNIVIEENKIDGCPVSAILAYAVTGLVVRGNHISRVNTATAPNAGQDNSLSATHPIEVNGALDPVVEGNSINPQP